MLSKHTVPFVVSQCLFHYYVIWALQQMAIPLTTLSLTLCVNRDSTDVGWSVANIKRTVWASRGRKCLYSPWLLHVFSASVKKSENLVWKIQSVIWGGGTENCVSCVCTCVHLCVRVGGCTSMIKGQTLYLCNPAHSGTECSLPTSSLSTVTFPQCSTSHRPPRTTEFKLRPLQRSVLSYYPKKVHLEE